MPSTKKLLVGVLGLGLTVTGLSLALPAAPAQAVGGVFISEFHYDNGPETDAGEFVEVTAPAGTDLSEYSIVRYNGSGGVVYTSPAATNELTGTVTDQQDGWGTGVVNYPANGLQNGDPDGIALVKDGTTVIEFLSYDGSFAATDGPAVGLTSTNIGVGESGSTPLGQSLQRLENNTWTGPAAEGKGTPNGFDTGEPGALSATAEPNAETTVDEPMTPVVLEATGGTPPYEWTTGSTLPAGVTLSTAGELSGTPTETGTFPITATVTDDVDATDDVSFTLTVNEPTPLLPIAEIQGTDTATSPEVGNEVRAQGVVTAMYKDPAFTTSSVDGMYIQTGGTGGATDTTPGASDAIFVFWGSAVAAADGIEIGDSVEVIGEVSEFQGTTEITVGVGDVTELGSPLPAATPLEIAYPTTEAGREAQEGMLLAPTDDFTVSNVFNANSFAEIGLATGDTPLVQPTDVADDDDATALQAVKDDNFARGVILDDGASVNYMTNNAAKGEPLPWLTTAGGEANPIRVGADATLTGPVVLEFKFGTWRFQPTSPVFGNGDAVATFEDTRTANMTPAVVPGDLKLATFNVLNYFNTTGEAYVANGAGLTPPTHCTYFSDRAGVPIGNNRCGRLNPPGSSQPNDGSGPRGAATEVSFTRQQQKIVTAINGLGADVVTLEELENSIKLPGETDRDDAISALVDALNADAGAGTWEFVPSPAEASQPGRVAEQDTIRNGFIYKPASVELVGQSDLLFGTTAFANAREPLAQAFKPTGAGDDMAFAVIVNHFKSKGDSDPAATGDNANNADTGAFNGDRVRQAQALVSFANEFAALRGTDKIFLTGDFNSYTHEDPITVLNDAGFDIVESDDANDESYSFGGLSGSLDHVLANEAALATVQGADIWEINADESVAFQYSRFNYNVTDFWQPNLPFAASDHNPEIVGFNPAASADVSTAIQILGTNDFHGRLLADGSQTTQDCDDVTCPAAVLSAAVKQLRSENANTVFSAAGDLIGASTFESFILDDEPTIDALNEAGLEVSAAGNHEFDQGYEDLVGRVQDRANWEYIAANVDEPEGRDDLAETWTQTFGDVEVGFVGAVTEELPALVSPAGIEGVTVTDIVDATNAAAADLKAGGADIVVLLVHEGSPSTDCASPNFTDPATVWGNISQNTSDDVDAIISGHTHLAYNCTIDGRPVVSAGQYGQNLNQLMFLVDGTSGDVTLSSQSLLPLTEANWGEDPAVVDIVHAAKAEADILGAEVLGEIEAPANRAKLSNGTTENRGGESTLGNLVAEVQQWATEDSHDAQIAFMNPGGLRADMPGNLVGDAREVTYRQAAVVQPFANTLVNMDLTGAQIETVLEQQWQRDSGGNVPSRPFLRLGVSEGFTYTYVETPVTVNGTATFEGEVTGMWLDGVAIEPATTYSVTVNSFLASGGDNFRELANGTGRADTGKVDLAAMVDYLDTFASTDPLALNYSQRAVEVHDVADSYVAGEQVQFEVESWSMSTGDDAKDTEIQVELGDTVLGTATLDNTVSDAVFDRTGTASVDVALPASTPAGPATLTLVGATTGTEVTVPITVEAGATTEVQILGTNDFHGRLLPDGLPTTSDCNTAGVGCPAALLSGAVKELRGENPNTVFAAAGDLIGASTFESFIQQDEPTIEALNEATLDVSATGNHEFDQGYEDLTVRVQDLADWEYIAANVDEPEGEDRLAETWTQEFGDVKVGFVGAVTEELPSLVSPAGIAGVTVTDIVDATNAAAADLKADGADMVVLLVHEGSPSTSCASPNFTDPATVWGNITQNTSADVDAIISGHTHLAYNCSFPVDEWVTDGRDVTERPVVSSGQYGQNLNQLLFTVDTATGEVMAKTQNILALTEANFTEDPAVVDIVHAAKAEADVLGAAVLGQVEAPLNRAKLSNGTTENRGGESTLGNLVAEVQRWATEAAEQGSAQIAFMNPGGLRQDMAGTVNGDARDVTYRQAAVVQPFANTLVNMDLTGAQIEKVLEQQWQRTADDASGTVPSRPFLRLGVSKGFTYTYVETPVTVNGTDTFEGEITGMWLNGVAIDPATTYSVTVNSFLASGGDNFRELANGTGRADTGKVDLQAMVDYLDEFAPVGDPLEIDYSQRAVEVHNVADSYAPGAGVEFDVESWTMSTADDVKDSEIVVMLGDTELGTATLDNTIGTAVYDKYGTAHVDVTLPADTPAGDAELTLVGENTGTEILVPITVAQATATVTGTDVSVDYGQSTTMEVTVEADGVVPTGEVVLKVGDVRLGSGTLVDGVAEANINRNRVGPGVHEVTIFYSGDGSVAPAEGTAQLTVNKATPTVIGSRTVVEYGQSTTMAVRVGATGVVPTGEVVLKVDDVRLGSGTLVDGQTAAKIGARKLPPGTYEVTIRYSGDEFVEKATGTATLVVKKATPTVVAPNTSMVFGEEGSLTVKVKAKGVVPTGTVVVRSESGVKLGATATLVDGETEVTLTAGKLPASSTPYNITIKYSGDEFVKSGTDTSTLRVRNP